MLASFIIEADDYDFETPSKYMDLSTKIESKEFLVDINVLGLRNLESFGLMPIKKPFIKFGIKSLLPPLKAQAVTNVKTDPNAAGPNPNINTLITFSVQLPVEELYCPKLSCEVYDYVFRGLSQPLIGTFAIPTGKIKAEKEKKHNELLDRCEIIIERLQNHLELSKEEMLAAGKEAMKGELSEEAREYLDKKMRQVTA